MTCRCLWCTGEGPPDDYWADDQCEHCDGDGCEDCLSEPDYEAIQADRDEAAYAAGEPVRWGGLDIPS